MTTRKRSGRTTPKGTKNPAKKSNAAAASDAGPLNRRDPTQRKGGNDKRWVARPVSHNRGNR